MKCGKGPQRTRDTTSSMKPTNNTKTLNPYLSKITLNVNGNTQGIRMLEKKQKNKNKTHLFAIYKRLILGLRTPSD